MSNQSTSQILTGRTLSPGLGAGPVFVYRDVLSRFDEFYDIDEAQVEEEQDQLARALEKISDDLNSLANRVEEEIDSELSDVFRAHMAMVQDPGLREEVEKEIREELVSAGNAVRTVFRRWERRFQAMDADVSQQKGDDIRDLARRIVSTLAGVHAHALENIPEGSVLVARRLLPSDAVLLARNTVAAALLEEGGRGSHAALFAREMGLPCLAGVDGLLDRVPDDSFVLVNADQGEAVLNPTGEQRDEFRANEARQTESMEEARSRAQQPAVTQNGDRIAVMANVGNAADTQAAVENGADGIGLYRLEQVYLGRQEPPGKGSLLKEMRDTLKPAQGMPVTVRLLDVGADKSLPFLETPRESNPALGVRGVRFLLKHPELLRTQLEALIELSSDHDLRILVPMVTLPGDMQAVKDALEEAASRAGISKAIPLGAMIETPAAALSGAALLEMADFVSFGTNDLTQYVFAADRENTAVDAYFDETNDVMFRLMRLLHEDEPSMPLSVCGQLAGRSDAVCRLLESGITTLSVVPPLIPAVKEAVRSC